jgi:hypothetical protein
LSGANDEEFHEEGIRQMLLALNYHLEETRSKIPMDANVLPTCLTKGATEEKMESRLFHIAVAELQSTQL